MGKFYLVGIAAFFIAISGQLQAQGLNQQADEEIAQGRAMVQAGVDEMIREELALTAEEGELFWPAYAAYRSETRALMDRYTAMITEYMRRYDSGDLSNEYASEARFYQLENKIEAEIDSQLALVVPLIEST
jgi:hypothetical protein